MMDFLATKQLLRKLGSGYRTLLGRDPSSVREFLAYHYLRGTGLEVGALDKPMKIPKGVKVKYVDRMDHDELLRQYPELSGKKLVDIDIVTDGETLREVANESQDFLIASHFLEHCEDPIATLKNFLRVCKPAGILFIALPDKRYTFDRDRPETTYEHLLRDHRMGAAESRRDHFREWVRYVDRKSELEVESESSRLQAMSYSIHFHVFTGPSMTKILERLREEEGMEFEMEAYLQNGDEFVSILRKRSLNSPQVL